MGKKSVNLFFDFSQMSLGEGRQRSTEEQIVCGAFPIKQDHNLVPVLSLDGKAKCSHLPVVLGQFVLGS